jgi:hypothetical protein
MTREPEVQSWIAWAREHLPASGDIPKISVTRSKFAVPWDDEYWRLFNDAQNVEDPLPELLRCFADELSGTPADPAVRFTALNLYHKLAHYILDHSSTSKYALFQEFAAWVRSNYPSLLERVKRIHDIAEFRNPALHRSVTSGTIDRIPGWCPEVINALCPPSVGD